MRKFASFVLRAVVVGIAAGLMLAPTGAGAQSQNLACTLLPAAVRTATTPVNSTDRPNPGWNGVAVLINVGTYTSGTITPTIQGKDPVSGTYYTVLAGSGIATSTGSPFVLRVFPGATAGTNVANDVLPGTWRVSVLGTGGPSLAYSVGCWLITR